VKVWERNLLRALLPLTEEPLLFGGFAGVEAGLGLLDEDCGVDEGGSTEEAG